MVLSVEALRRRRLEVAALVLSRGNSPADPSQATNVRWALMYPDAYEVGLPNQGVMILYEVLNELEDVLAERTYAVWPDLEKLMREQGEKLTGDERSAVETRLADLKEALAGTDIDEINSRTEMLMNASQEFTQKLYQQASANESAGAAGGAGGSSAPNDDEVVDAEIVDDEDK